MPSPYLAANISPEVLGNPANANNLSGLSANVPAKPLVNVTGLPDDMFAKYSKGPTAQLMPADPKKGYSTPYYAAYTNDGDMAGAVMVADGQKVRLVDKTTGDVVFEGVGPEGARLATSVANGISQDLGRKAAWAIQKPTDEGGWVSMAEERYDPKKQSVLGKLADFALPILGAILMPVTGGMSAAIAAGLGSAAGSALSSLAQGRSVEETLKRAALAGVTAGVGAKVVPMIGSALAPKSAMTDMLVAAQNKAVEMGLSTQPFSAALSAEAAKTAAEHPIRSALSKAFDATTGAVDDAASGVRSAVKGALSTATDAGKQAVEKIAGNTIAGTVAPVSVVGAGAPGAATGALAGVGTSATISNALSGQSGQSTLRGGDNSGTEIDTLQVTGNPPGTDAGALSSVVTPSITNTGTPVEEVVVRGGGNDTTTGGALADAATSQVNNTGTDVSGVDVTGSNDTTTGAVVGDVISGSEGSDTLEDTSTDDEIKTPAQKLLDWVKANPGLAAKLGLNLASLLGGAAAGGGSTTGGGIPPGFATAGTPGSLSDKFRAQLPAPSGPFGNLAGRDVSMTPEEWKTYGARPEQSFFANVPIRPSGIIDTSKRAPVNPGLNSAEAERPEVRPSQPITKPFTVTNAPTTKEANPGLSGFKPGTAGLGWGISQGSDGLYYSNQGDYEIPLGTREQAEAWVATQNKERDERLARQDFFSKADPSKIVTYDGGFYAPVSNGGWTRYATEAEAKSALAEMGAARNAAARPTDPTIPSSVSSTSGADMGFAANLPATGGQPLGAQGAASSQPAPNFNPGATIPDYMRDDGFNQPGNGSAPFAVALDKLRGRQAQPLPAPSKGFKVGGFAVRGPGTGRSDDIPARLSDGEYVIDAETVALLGDGSSQAGSKRLDEFRANIRKHKGRQLAKGKFSHDARKPEAYLQGGRV